MEKSIDIEVFLFKLNIPGCSHPLGPSVAPQTYLQSCRAHTQPQGNIPVELSGIHFLADHSTGVDHGNLGWPHISLYLELHQ